MFVVYILKTSRNTFYVGQTADLPRRLQEHIQKRGRGSKYLRAFSSFALVYKETYLNRGEALKREIALKKLTHSQKEKLASFSLN